jgi:putative transposase
MPRLSRLDAPSVLHHIMIGGIERRRIFRDDKDRDALLSRLGELLPATKTSCYAWALSPDHAHFLFRRGTAGLSHLMRKLLTGYAVCFNRRHRRHGQLFQNRYKSIICQADKYFLELVRYIHVNPIGAGVVKDLCQR